MLFVLLRRRSSVKTPHSSTAFYFCLAPLPQFHPPLCLSLLTSDALVDAALFEFPDHAQSFKALH
jgi:hypothetical protein